MQKKLAETKYGVNGKNKKLMGLDSLKDKKHLDKAKSMAISFSADLEAKKDEE